MIKITILSLLAICVLQCKAFAPQSNARTAFLSKTMTTTLNLQIPRITLPDAAAEAIESIDLLNPNDMTPSEYNAYSGAAIGGTLAFFLLPGAIVSGMPDVLGAFLGAAVKDFLFSALVGGGLAIYLSLRKDDIGGTVRGFGTTLLDKAGDVLGIADPQIEEADDE